MQATGMSRAAGGRGAGDAFTAGECLGTFSSNHRFEWEGGLPTTTVPGPWISGWEGTSGSTQAAAGSSAVAHPLSSHASQPNAQSWAKAALLQTCLCRLQGKLHMDRGDVFFLHFLKAFRLISIDKWESKLRKAGGGSCIHISFAW